MKAGIVVFPGINRERDMAIALKPPSAHEPRMVWHKDTDLAGLDLVVIPGGFSFGDYLRCGAMAAQSPIMRAVHAHADARRLCAGRLQRLPDPDRGRDAARRAAAQRLAALPVDGLPPAGRTRRHRLHQPLPARPDVPRASWPTATATISPTTRRSTGWKARTWSPSATPTEPATSRRRPTERQRPLHRRHPQPQPARARPDAASRGPGRPADGRHRRQAAVRRASPQRNAALHDTQRRQPSPRPRASASAPRNTAACWPSWAARPR